MSKQFVCHPGFRIFSPFIRTSLQSISTKAIVVACLASFPSLFKKSERAERQRIFEGNGQSHSYMDMCRKLFSGGKKSKTSQEDNDNISMENVDQQHSHIMKEGDMGFSAPWHDYSKSSSGERILPLDKAHVRYE